MAPRSLRLLDHDREQVVDVGAGRPGDERVLERGQGDLRAVLEQGACGGRARRPRRARRSSPSMIAPACSVPPSEPSVSMKTAATGAPSSSSAAAIAASWFGPPSPNPASGPSVTVLSPPQPSITEPGANGAPVGGAVAGEVGEQLADLARLALEAGRDDDRRQAERDRLGRHRIAGGRAGDQQDRLDPVGGRGRGTRESGPWRCSRIDSRRPVPQAVSVEDRDRVAGAGRVGHRRVGDRVDVVAGDVGDGQVDEPSRAAPPPRAGRP